MNEQIDLSVVFATYRRPSVLRQTLEAFSILETDSVDWELICVDNSNDESSRKVIESFTSELPLVFIEEKKPGKNAALNAAIPYVRGEIVVLTDDDVSPRPDWLKEILAATKRWSEFSLFGGRILPKVSGYSPLLDIPSHHIASAYAIADWKLPEGPYHPGKVWGANIAVRRKVFELGHRFDESVGPAGKNYVMGSETSFVRSLVSEGFEAVYIPSSLVFHRITDEQLTEDWLRERAFRSGRGAARNRGVGNMPLFFGVPRYLFRLIVTCWFDKAWQRIFGDEAKRISSKMNYGHTLGMISEYRRMRGTK